MYRKHLDKDLICDVLGKIQATHGILFKDNDKDNESLRQYDFFKENMFEFMLYVALMIFQDKQVFNIAVEVLTEHSSGKNLSIILNNMTLFNAKIREHRNKNYKLKTLEDATLLNCIYTELYFTENKISMFHLKPLINYLLQAQNYVENLIVTEIKDRVDKYS